MPELQLARCNRNAMQDDIKSPFFTDAIDFCACALEYTANDTVPLPVPLPVTGVISELNQHQDSIRPL